MGYILWGDMSYKGISYRRTCLTEGLIFIKFITLSS